jgi:hypothetical protein
MEGLGHTRGEDGIEFATDCYCECRAASVLILEELFREDLTVRNTFVLKGRKRDSVLVYALASFSEGKTMLRCFA